MTIAGTLRNEIRDVTQHSEVTEQKVITQSGIINYVKFNLPIQVDFRVHH